MRHTHTDILLVPLGVLAFAAALAGALLVGGTPVAGGVIASIVTGGLLTISRFAGCFNGASAVIW